VRTEDNQFIQLWMTFKHDFEEYQNFLSKHLQEQLHH